MLLRLELRGSASGQIIHSPGSDFEPIMTKDSESTEFPGEAFPTTYTLLYCPLTECNVETPFCHARTLVQHLKEAHAVDIYKPETVISFLDRYLSMKSVFTPVTLGGPEDKADWDLRQRLQEERLQQMLGIQENERATTHRHPRSCLFCKDRLADRYALFKHMYRQHAFNIGQLDNLVMVDEFLSVLEAQLVANTCIYCHKVFPSASLLRKHLKHKSHYKIPSSDRRYDKYYVVNYTQAGKTWDMLPTEEADRDESESDNWSDLNGSLDRPTQCLFCTCVCSSPEEALEHMADGHKFFFRDIQATLQLDFYGSVKFVNYLRHQRAEMTCPGCLKPCDSDDQLVTHITPVCIAALLEKRRPSWDRVEYHIPIYDDDPLLEVIDDLSDNLPSQ